MTFFADHLQSRRLMAILRGHGQTRTVELCLRAWAAGVALVEVPVQSDEDLRALHAAVAAGRDEGRPVGAGTVTSTELVGQAADAGAAFTVAPGLVVDVLRASQDAGLPHLPGVATATEIQAAVQLGASWLKAFPASVLGAGWFAAMHGPFPDVHLVATGGMDATNAQAFLDAGAAAVSLGSAFADADPEALRRLGEGGR
jgi:2-dehydro-3-deoxyphosphogluconate aldolase / (4S)-4-hydroxy-2-oxoglutarate aldolase